MTAAILLAAGVLTPLLLMQAQDGRALDEYRHALAGYVHLHRAAEATLPPGRPCGSAEAIEERRVALANAIRRARHGAREGAIVDGRVADLLRARLDIALAELDMEAYDVRPAEPGAGGEPLLAVNEFFPWEAEPERWATVFWILPPLPDELAYRIVGTDLVLVDVEARLVVDVLRNAIQHVPADAPRLR